MNLDIEQLDSAQFELRSKAKSLQHGRHIYRFEDQGQFYWLKAQQPGVHATVEQGFAQEWNFYKQYAQSSHLSFLLPCQLIDAVPIHIQSHDISFHYLQVYSRALILPEAKAALSMGNLPEHIEEIKHIFWRVFEAVEALHQLDWIHADLKAEHLVQLDGQIKLLDFEQVQKVTDIQCQEITATPRYMAPELFHGQPKTAQSDIYALGIIFYEWLTQQRLQANSYHDWAYLHCQRLHIQLPAHLQAFLPLLNHMLAKPYSQRASSIAELKLLLSG
ncbi:serine/threonine protein kinase [Acinetobacter towneri]|uniref:serine/threonine protein kinase n=1 Tax=Acinetobacter towneri TaxID=202956 RepID=UPI001D0D551C|nr:protein kinase [Acinetobacter towneri]